MSACCQSARRQSKPSLLWAPRVAEKFDDPAAAVGATPPRAEARVTSLQAEGAHASVVAASSSTIEPGVDAARVKGTSSTETAAVVESVSHADEAAYEEVRLQELEFDALEQLFVYPCPCGDLFELPLAELRAAAAGAETQGFALASCPSCSLKIRVLFDTAELKLMEEELSIAVLSDETEFDKVQQPQTCVADVAKGDVEAGRACEGAANAAVSADKQHTADAKDASSAEECTKTFWSAFNTPLRKDVFESCAATEAAASSSAEGYLDAVEEAVRSLRRFRVEQRRMLSDEASAEGRNVVLHDGRVVHVLDVAQDAGKRAAIASFDGPQESGEFEYDLYAIECDSEDVCSPLPPFAAREAHKQRLLELLQQDRSAVALVEVEDVDKDTGLVTRGCGGMQLFLEEFGDIDDSDSGKAQAAARVRR
ncbi:hypothetical protein Emag_003644 [Eimeria magna]